MTDQLEKFVKEHRADFDTLEPGIEVLDRIKRNPAITQVKSKGVLIAFKRISWAAAVVFIVFASFITWLTLKTKNQDITGNIQTKVKIDSPALQKTAEINPLQEKQAALIATSKSNKIEKKQALTNKLEIFTGLSNSESASQRVAAALSVGELKNSDREITDILVKTMNTDPNSNVRMAALEALCKFYKEAYVKQQLVKSLSKQKDPIVQIALIQVLAAIKQLNITNELHSITTDPDINPAVKNQAYSILLRTNSL
jgi:hypothetical protein